MAALSFDEFRRQFTNGLQNDDWNYWQLETAYNQYLDEYDQQTGGPTVTPSYPDSPFIYQPPDRMSDFEEAGMFGANQAAGVYSQGLPTREIGPLTQQSYDMISSVAGQPYTQNALAAMNQQIGNTNPYMNQFSTANPTNFNRFTGLQSGYGNNFDTLANQTNPYISQIGGMAQSNPYTWLLNFNNQNPYAAKLNFNNQNPYAAKLNFNNQNPYTGLLNFNNQNPYAANMTDANPYTASMNYTAPQVQTDFNAPLATTNYDTPIVAQSGVNPYIDQIANFGAQQDQNFQTTVNRALEDVEDRINSQFGVAGRSQSGYHSKIMNQELGDVASQMYSDNFQDNANRALQALTTGADIYGTDEARALQAAGMNIDALNQSRQLGQAGELANIDATLAAQGLGLEGSGINVDAYLAAQGLGLEGTGLNQAAYNAAQERNLSGTGMNMDAYNTSQTQNLANIQAGMDALNTSQAQNLANIQAGMGAYNTSQAQNLANIQAGMGAFDTSQAQNLANIQAGMGAFDTFQDRYLNSLIQAGDLQNRTTQNQLAAAQAGATEFLNNANLNIDATQRNADLWQQGYQNQFSQNQALADMYNTDQNRAITAAQLMPGMQNEQATLATLLNTLGVQQDELAQQNANLPWQNLQNYANIISTLQGSQPVAQEESSSLDRLLGLGSLAIGFGGLL